MKNQAMRLRFVQYFIKYFCNLDDIAVSPHAGRVD